MQPKPLAVLIGDIHYSLTALHEASMSMYHAIDKANELRVPLIVAGDLHDSKANMRAECVNEMLEVFQHAAECTSVYIIIGNHDKINEKSREHSLNFLKEHAIIVNNPRKIKELNLYLFPYFDNLDALRTELRLIPNGSTLIMHQGIKGSDSGEYIIDKSAINKEDVSDFRVVSSHYHKRQTIKTGRPQAGHVGLWDYVGSPFTHTFGEAKDPAKGFQILMSDGSLEFVPTNLRKHVVVEVTMDGDGIYYPAAPIKQNDLVWVKVTGKDLQKVTKQSIRKNLESLDLPADFRLDLIPDETEFTPIIESGHQMSQSSLLEQTINSVSDISDDRKTKINNLWKTFV